MTHVAGKPTDIANFITDLYDGPVSLKDLQARVLLSVDPGQEGGPTPDKDQIIQKMVYDYIQSGKAGMDPSFIDSFSPTLAWICVGPSLTKMLSLAPKSSLEDLISFAAQKGFQVDVGTKL